MLLLSIELSSMTPLKKNLVLSGALVFVALLVTSILGLSVVKAQAGELSLKQMIALVAGHEIAQKVDTACNQVSSDFLVPAQQPVAGVGGDTFFNQKQALVVIATSTESRPDTASTTLDQGALMNPTVANGGRQRLITRLFFMSASSSATYLSGPLIMDFNTTTNQYTSSSKPIYSATLTTSTNPVLITTSSPAGARTDGWSMIWNPGEYLHCTTNRIVSTTNGACGADYLIVQ